jgi:ADP-heptose:LPS heptosyltransferase
VKVLFVRFSSIGDIVLTFPVVRCTKEQVPNVEIHYLTKTRFHSLLSACPQIDRAHVFQGSLFQTAQLLRKEKFDLVIDLHHNLRTTILLALLGRPFSRFKKLNFQKWLLTRFKRNVLPKIHVVDRYFGAVKKLGVVNDLKNNQFFISEEIYHEKFWDVLPKNDFIAMAIGAQFATKKLRLEGMIEFLSKVKFPVILLGGEEDNEIAQRIIDQLKPQNIIHLCGKTSISGSAAIVKKAKVLVTHDTGMMHIASCFEVPILTIWGNTVKDFGMYAYRPENNETVVHFEVQDLACRPCSKIGHASCPKGHFKCMKNQDLTLVAETAQEFFYKN